MKGMMESFLDSGVVETYFLYLGKLGMEVAHLFFYEDEG